MKTVIQKTALFVLTLSLSFGLQAQKYKISTYVGKGIDSYSGDGGLAVEAEISRPVGMVVDSDGNLIFGDRDNSRIRKVNKATGIITTIAGNGTKGFGGDGGPAINASLSNPDAVDIDSEGNIYIADNGNFRVRKINHATGNIETIAGKGGNSTALHNYNGPALDFNVGNITSIALSKDEKKLFMSQTYFQYILVLDLESGNLKVAVGTGQGGYSGDNGDALAAKLYNPMGLKVDNEGNLYIQDVNNNRIRKVDHATNIITTFAGNGSKGFTGDGGLAIDASFQDHFDLAIDPEGNIFIVDQGNNRIRKVDSSTGIVTTIAGVGTAGYSGDGGSALDGQLNRPRNIASDSDGNLFIGEWNNFVVRKLSPGPVIKFSMNPLVICAKDSVQFSNNSPSTSITYKWLFQGGSPSVSNDFEPPVVYYGAPGTYNVLLIGTNSNGKDTLTQTIEVFTLPEVKIAGNTSFCEGSSEILTASSNVSSPSYLWSNGNTTPFTIISKNGDLSVSVTDDLGCTNSDTVHVNAHALPIVGIVGDELIYKGDSSTLYAIGASTYTYKWSTGSVYDTTIVTPNTSSIYSVVATDTNGCESTASFLVEVDSTLGLTDLTNNKNIIMYPNPATHNVYFEFEGYLLSDKTTIRVIDMMGKTVSERGIIVHNNEKVSLDIQNLERGIYTVKITSDSYTKDLRLVKQ